MPFIFKVKKRSESLLHDLGSLEYFKANFYFVPQSGTLLEVFTFFFFLHKNTSLTL